MPKTCSFIFEPSRLTGDFPLLKDFPNNILHTTLSRKLTEQLTESYSC